MIDLDKLNLTYAHQRLKILDYWERGITGEGVRVMTIDGGVGPHADITVAGGYGVTTTGLPLDYRKDDNAHGTHTAAIIAGRPTVVHKAWKMADGTFTPRFPVDNTVVESLAPRPPIESSGAYRYKSYDLYYPTKPNTDYYFEAEYSVVTGPTPETISVRPYEGVSGVDEILQCSTGGNATGKISGMLKTNGASVYTIYIYMGKQAATVDGVEINFNKVYFAPMTEPQGFWTPDPYEDPENAYPTQLGTYVDTFPPNSKANPNMLPDTNAPSLLAVAGPLNRYWTYTNVTSVTPTIKRIADTPRGAMYGIEAVSDGSGTATQYRSLCWYTGGEVAFEVGQTYTMSCYARLVSGVGKVRFQYGVSPFLEYSQDVTASTWELFTWTFTATQANARVHMPAGWGGGAGTIQTCMFKVEKGATATPYVDGWEVASKYIWRTIPADERSNPRPEVSVITARETCPGMAWGVELYTGKYSIATRQSFLVGVLEGVKWALRNNIDILSMSIDIPEARIEPWPDIRKEMVEVFEQVAASEMICIVAAGNFSDGTEDFLDRTAFLQKRPGVLPVGNMSYMNDKYINSNMGSVVQYAGYGDQIKAGVRDTTVTTASTKYGTMTGTSMATPQVSSIFAMYKQLFPTLNKAQLIAKVNENCEPLPNVPKAGQGRGLIMPPPELYELDKVGEEDELQLYHVPQSYLRSPYLFESCRMSGPTETTVHKNGVGTVATELTESGIYTSKRRHIAYAKTSIGGSMSTVFPNRNRADRSTLAPIITSEYSKVAIDGTYIRWANGDRLPKLELNWRTKEVFTAGKKLTVSFTFYRISGTVTTLGGTVSGFNDDIVVRLDGVNVPNQKWSTGITLTQGERIEVEVTFTAATGSFPGGWIINTQANPGLEGMLYEFSIRNLKIEDGEVKTPYVEPKENDLENSYYPFVGICDTSVTETASPTDKGRYRWIKNLNDVPYTFVSKTRLLDPGV